MILRVSVAGQGGHGVEDTAGFRHVLRYAVHDIVHDRVPQFCHAFIEQAPEHLPKCIAKEVQAGDRNGQVERRASRIICHGLPNPVGNLAEVGIDLGMQPVQVRGHGVHRQSFPDMPHVRGIFQTPLERCGTSTTVSLGQGHDHAPFEDSGLVFHRLADEQAGCGVVVVRDRDVALGTVTTQTTPAVLVGRVVRAQQALQKILRVFGELPCLQFLEHQGQRCRRGNSGDDREHGLARDAELARLNQVVMQVVQQDHGHRLAGTGLPEDLHRREAFELASDQLRQESSREPAQHLGKVR